MRRFKIACALVALTALVAPAQAADDLTRPIRASPDGHFLMQPDGQPFFWLGDTAWELFHRLDRAETERYLQDRARKGFNIIQAVAIGKLDTKGLRNPNRYGEVPFLQENPARPNERYFEHIDWVINRAAHYRLRVALLPTWGAIFVSGGGAAQVFNFANAEEYGRWLGRRYRGKGIIWVLGGDIPPIVARADNKTGYQTLVDYRPVYDAMAHGIIDGSGEHSFITYHPSGANLPGAAEPRMSLYFGDRDWFDMSMLQSSHYDVGTGEHDGGSFRGDDGPLWGRVAFVWNSRFNYMPVASEYRALPTRPVIDGEPHFEDHPILGTGEMSLESSWKAHDARNALYQALFAGAAGHTYGHVSIWDFYDPARPPTMPGAYDNEFAELKRRPWQEALDAEAAGQMQYAKSLLLSRSYFSRVPDQTLIVGEAGEGSQHIAATRDKGGSYAMVYLPQGQPATVDLTKVSGTSAIGWWFDPRSGKASRIEGAFTTNQPQRFTPPTSGPDQDWVLVIDDVSKNFSIPGSATP